MTEQKTFTVPTRLEVSEKNRTIFDGLHKGLGFVPNLYAYFGKNETALADYLALKNRETTLTAKEREVINLVTSQINGCRYCQSTHTVLGEMNGFTDDQIIEIRKGTASFDYKLDALVRFAASVVTNRGNAMKEDINRFFGSGYTEANMIDVVMLIGEKTIGNFLHNLTRFEIDFPLADEI